MASKETNGQIEVQGWAAMDDSGILKPFTFTRRKPGVHDVVFKVLYCGIDHTDLHQLRNDWGTSSYPMVAGHEITGIVTEVGGEAKKFKVGDKVGVGGMVGSCEECEYCLGGLHQYCPKTVSTYHRMSADAEVNYGGFSTLMVCNERYVFNIPEGLKLEEIAPLLCGGMCVFSPMKQLGMLKEPGKKLGVVGLGGVGHMAVKFGKAFGLHVTVISTSSSKEKEAREVLGADGFINSKDPEQMTKAVMSLDYLVDTVSADHDLASLLQLLKYNGKMVIAGAPSKTTMIPVTSLFGGKFVGGSLWGGLEDTQEVLNLCAEHNVSCMVEVITMDYVNIAMERLAKGDVRYRFVADIQGSLQSF